MFVFFLARTLFLGSVYEDALRDDRPYTLGVLRWTPFRRTLLLERLLGTSQGAFNKDTKGFHFYTRSLVARKLEIHGILEWQLQSATERFILFDASRS